MGPAHTRPYILRLIDVTSLECISPSVQMHCAETDLRLAAVLQLHVWIRKRSKFFSFSPHSLTATSLPNTSPLSLNVFKQYSNL